jgi:hypothetical protein
MTFFNCPTCPLIAMAATLHLIVTGKNLFTEEGVFLDPFDGAEVPCDKTQESSSQGQPRAGIEANSGFLVRMWLSCMSRGG